MAGGVDDGVGGEVDIDGGAVVGGGGAADEIEGAAVFADDAATDPEAEAGAALALGGEEGLEKILADGLGDAGAVVGDGDEDAGSAVQAVVSDVACAGLGGERDGGGAGLRLRMVRGDGGAFGCGAGGFGGVGEDVGEDLAKLGGEATNDQTFGQVAGDVDAERGEAALHEEEERLEHFLEVDGHRRARLAVERKHGA